MKLIQSLSASSWAAGFKHVTCARPDCSRWLTQRHLDTRKVGVTYTEKWYCSYRCVAGEVERQFSKMIGPGPQQAKHSFRMPLGLALVSRGYLTHEQLKEANEQQRAGGRDMAEVLLAMGAVGESELTAVQASQWGCPVSDVPPAALSCSLRIPANLTRRFRMVPLEYSAKLKKISVGFVAGIEYGALYALEQITGCKAQPFLIPPRAYADYLRSCPKDAEDEHVFDHLQSPSEMRHILCTYGAQMDAEDVSLARCGKQVWARLRGTGKIADLLFATA